MNNNINILIVEPGKALRPAVTANTMEKISQIGGHFYQLGKESITGKG